MTPLEAADKLIAASEAARLAGDPIASVQLAIVASGFIRAARAIRDMNDAMERLDRDREPGRQEEHDGS